MIHYLANVLVFYDYPFDHESQPQRNEDLIRITTKLIFLCSPDLNTGIIFAATSAGLPVKVCDVSMATVFAPHQTLHGHRTKTPAIMRTQVARENRYWKMNVCVHSYTQYPKLQKKVPPVYPDQRRNEQCALVSAWQAGYTQDVFTLGIQTIALPGYAHNFPADVAFSNTYSGPSPSGCYRTENSSYPENRGQKKTNPSSTSLFACLRQSVEDQPSLSLIYFTEWFRR